MFAAEDLTCSRNKRAVLSNVHLELRPGEVLGVLGANGAGKTTLLATLAGELRGGGGSVTLDARPLGAWTTQALARRRAVLPQSPSLAFDLDVRTVVDMGAYPFPEVTPRELRSLVDRALVLADAQHLARRRYRTLSGGEQQRVQFARTLVQLLAGKRAGEYRALFLDEPTASLDPRHQIGLLRAVSTLAHEEHVAALAVLHDVNLAASWCDRLLLLAAGEVVAEGPPAEVLTPDCLEQVYGVPAQVVGHPDAPGRPLVLFSAGRHRAG